MKQNSATNETPCNVNEILNVSSVAAACGFWHSEVAEDWETVEKERGENG
ncbi:MAG: hypothetical protein SPF38_01735 [Dysosmobacter sp.]|nr:hypothetical protein [Dysosmobacter sp.]